MLESIAAPPVRFANIENGEVGLLLAPLTFIPVSVGRSGVKSGLGPMSKDGYVVPPGDCDWDEKLGAANPPESMPNVMAADSSGCIAVSLKPLNKLSGFVGTPAGAVGGSGLLILANMISMMFAAL